jgi:hypothetical protein
MAATIGFYLSGVIAIAIIFIGCRFLLAPSTAASAYGVPTGANRICWLIYPLKAFVPLHRDCLPRSL